MSPEELGELLSLRAPGDWELYRKSGESRETFASADTRTEVSRREEGWAARWREQGAMRFVAASTPEDLAAAIPPATRLPGTVEPPLEWPSRRFAPAAEPGSPEPPQPLFDELARLVSAESRGEATLMELALRRGASFERVVNGRGLDATMSAARLDGWAVAVGRRDARSCEARTLFRWDGAPDLAALARRLSDRATLPLSERASPFPRGEWLLDPSVAASLLAALSPLFTAAARPPWATRGHLFSPAVTIVDDATADAPCDGEGTPTRRVVLVQEGSLVGRLHDLRTARASGEAPTGHGVRASWRTPPRASPRRLFFEGSRASGARELLGSVRSGLFASAVTAPARLNLAADRFEIEFTGIAVVAGRAHGPVARARAAGRLSDLLRRITAVSTDRQFFPLPYPVGAPSLLVEKTNFE